MYYLIKRVPLQLLLFLPCVDILTAIGCQLPGVRWRSRGEGRGTGFGAQVEQLRLPDLVQPLHVLNALLGRAQLLVELVLPDRRMEEGEEGREEGDGRRRKKRVEEWREEKEEGRKQKKGMGRDRKGGEERRREMGERRRKEEKEK